MRSLVRRNRERRIQKLIRAHPYLLDPDLLHCRGRIERTVKDGRIDIDFETEAGWVIVECKITPLTNRDVAQLCRYLRNMAEAGRPVCRAYLVGSTPRKELKSELLQHSPGIIIKKIPKDLPTFLAFSEGKHYFDADLEICPYDGTRRIVGKELSLAL